MYVCVDSSSYKQLAHAQKEVLCKTDRDPRTSEEHLKDEVPGSQGQEHPWSWAAVIWNLLSEAI